MTNDNDITIQSYNDHTEEYLRSMSSSTSDDIKRWIDRMLKLVPLGGRVLELGSGAGRDATYMESLGYHVVATDAAQGFVDRLQKAGHETKQLNALTDEYGNDYDLLFANAVLLHFSPEDVKTVLRKAHDSLNEDGIMAFSVKQGQGSEWLTEKIDAPRQFYYWNKPDIEQLLKDSDFSIVEITEGKSRKASWHYVIAKRDTL